MMGDVFTCHWQAPRLVSIIYIAWYVSLGISIVVLCRPQPFGVVVGPFHEKSLRGVNGDMRYAALIAENGRNYPPGLYPQVPNVSQFTHETTWYATSAYIDMRTLVYGGLPTISIVAAGPVKEVELGSKWSARVHKLQTGAVVTGLDCGLTQVKPFDTLQSKHTDATVICRIASVQWLAISPISEELGVCLVRNLDDASCDSASIIPVGVPPRYPQFPLAWADTYIAADEQISKSPKFIQDEQDYLNGKGRVAMCVPGVRGDMYAESIRFFLKYYRKMGVDTVNLYMHSPRSMFTRIVEGIASEQDLGAAQEFPRLVLLPWCVQLGATYGCKKGQPVAPGSGYFDFVGTNHGQLLAHQDCRPEFLSLHDLVAASAGRNQGVAAAEIVMRTAFYDNCLPSSSGNVTVSLSPSIDPLLLTKLPRPAWAAARVSKIYPESFREKYMCNPYECDRVTVHRAASKLTDRKKYKDKGAYWPTSGKREVIHEHDATIHHTRLDGRTASQRERLMTRTRNEHDFNPHDIPQCHLVEGVKEQDWGMTNFVINVLGII